MSLMSDLMDSNQIQASDSIAKSPSVLPAGVYMIRRGKDQKPHSISVPVTAEDVEQHRRKTKGAPRHYPLTLNESGQERPLHEFHTRHEFLSALFGSVTAHKHLWEDAKKLHGNICPNVIFINEHGKGVLVDWDNHLLAENDFRRLSRDMNYGDVKRDC